MTFAQRKMKKKREKKGKKKGNSIEIRAVKDHARRLYETNEVIRGWLDFSSIPRSIRSIGKR